MLCREMGTKSDEANALPLLEEITLSQGDTTTARLLIEKSCMLYRELGTGNKAKVAWTFFLLAKVIAAQGDLTAARALYEESLIPGKGMNSNLSSLDLPAALEGLAAVAAAQGEAAWAARLWGTAEAQREAHGTPLAPIFLADYEQAVTAARTHLGERSFATAWAEGRSTTFEQALAAQTPLTKPISGERSSTPPAKFTPTYPDGLTTREVKILRLVANGLTDVQVAQQLVISPRTVNWHLTSLYRKIQVSSSSAATRYAIEHHVL